MFIIRVVILHFCYKLDGFTFRFILDEMLVSHFCHPIGKIFWSYFLIYWKSFANNLMANLGSIYRRASLTASWSSLIARIFAQKFLGKFFMNQGHLRDPFLEFE